MLFFSLLEKKQRKQSGASFQTLRSILYPEPGSNRHGLLHWCLRPARLPIPPSGREGDFFIIPTGCRWHPVQAFSLDRLLKQTWIVAQEKSLAERGGFEPPVRLPVRQFSKLLVSATHPSLLALALAGRPLLVF